MKKYTLKPGRHQFAPGEQARHDNDNLTDAEAEWYLERYPHIAKLFVERLKCFKVETLDIPKKRQVRKAKQPAKSKTTPQHSNLSTLQPSNNNL